ncbi:MAG TPA: SDR family oxidoreductase [Acidimicrobiia bacterium]|nr:SDR family oxidoreductase [Acidimicrobiia bacterium]
MGLDGRVALVTGGGRGIGRAIALALAGDGAAVAVNYRRDEDAAAETVAEIEKNGGRAAAYQASVDSLDDCQRMAEAVLADFGHVDILVNNAGLASRGKSVVSTEPDEIHRLVATHAFGGFYLCHLLVEQMRSRPRGDVIFVSSQATTFMAGWSSPYNMAKAAQEALAMTLAKEEVRNGIRVNVVAPGLVATEMGERLVKATVGVDDIHDLDAAMPLGRVTAPEDVAAVVRFLVSEEGGFVTGQRIGVDGGGMPQR